MKCPNCGCHIASVDAGDFEEFYQAYPRKKSKGQAERAWAKLKPDEKELAIADVKIRPTSDADWVAELKNGKKHIPYPATYLNAKGWEDEWEPVKQEDDSWRIDPETGKDVYEL